MQTLKEFLDTLSPEALIERLELALEGSGLGIWDWDLRDDSVQFDRRWCEMLGLDHASTPMALTTWSSRVHPEDLARCYADIRAHVEGRAAEYSNVHRMRHADGRWLYILDRGRISGRDELGRPIRFTGTHADITATEEARRVIAAHDEALRALVAALPTGVAMLDRQLRYLTASARWCAAVGRELGALRGEPFGGSATTPAERWRPALEQALAGESRGGDEEQASPPGAPPRFRRWDARPWHMAGGEIGGVLVGEEDVTARVLAERERNTRLTTLALFSGGIAHEINSPLQVILTEAQLGQRLLGDAPLDLASLREAFDAIEATALRAAGITRALRTLSRDARNDPAGPVDLGAVVSDALALTRARLASSGISLTLDDRAGAAQVLGRASELLHVLLNLINNAADAVLGRAGAWVRLEVEAGDGLVHLRCVDSGPGVAAADQARLMTPFFTTKEQGTGIGLSLCRALVERDGGYLRYVPGAEQTTFEVGLQRFAGGAGGAHPHR